jgi:tripartite ATP-independent transporter DctM subunit
MSGSIVGDAAGVGKILIPNMKKEGYSAGYSACMTATSACIGAIIPPSINAIIVGTVGQISILRLWLGGIVPGITVGVVLIIIGYFISKKRKYTPARKMAPIREIMRSTRSAFLVLVVPVFILGGMRLGLFTPTEAAAFGIFYVLVIGFLIYRKLSLSGLSTAAWDTGKTAGAILWLIGMGIVFGTVLHLCKAEEIVTRIVLEITESKLLFLVGVNLVLIVLGLFMEISSIILIMLPITLPIAKAFGINPVHFGVLFNIVVIFGAATPPFGVTVYVTTAIGGCSVEEYVRDGWLLWVALLFCFVLFTAFPQLSLWLPDLVMGSEAG